MNILFIVWMDIYDDLFSKLFGDVVFVGLYYFLGSLIFFLLEIIVVVKNYECLILLDFNIVMVFVS